MAKKTTKEAEIEAAAKEEVKAELQQAQEEAQQAQEEAGSEPADTLTPDSWRNGTKKNL